MLVYFLGSKQSKIHNVDFDKLTDIFIVALPISILCARLYYVIFEWSYYSANPADILNIREGGLAIHSGGILGAVISGYIMSRILKKGGFFRLIGYGCPMFYNSSKPSRTLAKLF